MNRSLAYLGVGVILTGIALVSFPIVVGGSEIFDIEQEAGLLVAPVGLVVVLFAAVAHDPRQTTVGGAFGNPDEPAAMPRSRTNPPPRLRQFSPSEAASCRHCRTFITADLAQCPRCARARECRRCGRPLGLVLDRATCPRCAHPEASCNCTALVQEPEVAPLHGHGW
ncbi:MAG TPA: hypothetical protein VK455_07120 [Thermoplasmata archaeon]|nr:hypothetical protein [Thermoplasmata archaeon]